MGRRRPKRRGKAQVLHKAGFLFAILYSLLGAGGAVKLKPGNECSNSFRKSPSRPTDSEDALGPTTQLLAKKWVKALLANWGNLRNGSFRKDPKFMKKQIICTTCIAIFTLIVATGCSTLGGGGGDERSEGRSLDDENITSSIREALDQEPVYKFTNVEVNTFAGEVQLSGFVNTDEQKRVAGEIASRERGVVNVHNNLVMKPFAVSPTGRTNAPAHSQIYSTPPPTQQPQPSSERP